MVTTTRKRLAWSGVAAATIGALVLRTYPHLRQEIINWLEGVPQPSGDEDEVKDDTRPSTPTREKITLSSATVERIVREKPEHPVLAPTAVDVPASSRQVLLRQKTWLNMAIIGTIIPLVVHLRRYLEFSQWLLPMSIYQYLVSVLITLTELVRS